MGANTDGATEKGSWTGFWTSPRWHVGRAAAKRAAREGRGAGRSELAKPVSPRSQEKPLGSPEGPVPQTDTGGWVEHTKAIGRTMVKELGKIAP